MNQKEEQQRNHEEERIAGIMAHYGRKFESHIGYAYLAGDIQQRAKLVGCFPELFAHFGKIPNDRRIR